MLAALMRLLDPDMILRNKIVDFVERGDFGLASGRKQDGTYQRVWFQESLASDEVAFESGVFLLTKARAQALKSGPVTQLDEEKKPPPEIEIPISDEHKQEKKPEGQTETQAALILLTGDIPPEVWNRLGTKILPKLRQGSDLKVGIDLAVTVTSDNAANLATELRQILEDLGLADRVGIQQS